MEDLKNRLAVIKKSFDELAEHQDIGAKQGKLGDLESRSYEPGFWDDAQKAQGVMREISTLKEEIRLYTDLERRIREAEEFIALGDSALESDIEAHLAFTATEFEKLMMTRLFMGKFDLGDAILSIHAGTGGVDAQDWAQMLERMYLRLCDSKGWRAKILDESPAEEAGIKSVEIEIRGEKAYGYLKAEHGVHRLVRLSPFNAKNSRETSFVLVEVLPLVEGAGDVMIDEKDLKIEVFRAGGHGGQGVNTTDSAVRITHIPSGLVAQCQNERSQLQNKQNAMKILRSRLQHQYDKDQLAALEKTKGIYKQGTWGNQIRSYVLQPYTMVKDHRTEHEVSNVQKVLDGELEDFMLAWLKWGK